MQISGVQGFRCQTTEDRRQMIEGGVSILIAQRAQRMAHSVDNSEKSENSNALPYAPCALLLNPKSEISETIRNPKSKIPNCQLAPCHHWYQIYLRIVRDSRLVKVGS